jgi:putative ABC transport system permease protein
MNAAQLLLEALRSLAANRLRSALTMLGIVIGIASVVLMLSLGTSVRALIDKELAVLGSNQLFVQPGMRTEGGARQRVGDAPSLTIDDAAALNELASVRGAAAVKQGYFRVLYGNDNSDSMVMGVTPEMFRIRNWKMERGVALAEVDVRSANPVVVIGAKIADTQYYRRDPLGQTLRIDGKAFTVIGVLAGKGRTLDGTDLGELLVVPITSIPLRMASPRLVHYISAQARNGADLSAAERDIADLLRDRHRIYGDARDDFEVTNLATIVRTIEVIGGGVAVGLGAIGLISLVVGGIGIMNIMLVSVSERIREIGIRMAIGAKPSHVLAQFLCEAVLLCVLGGLAGVALAALGAWGVTQTGKIELSLSVTHMLTSIGFATAVGVFFGFYPAHRASRLLPIECLRQD